MKKHFVAFHSPGTFFDEQTEKPIDSWNLEKAVAMAHEITERYGATPYGFKFITRARKPNELDSKMIKSSPMHHLGGRIMTLEDVKKEMPEERILIGNMQNNDIANIIVNTNSWKHTGEFGKDDILLDFTPRKKKS